MRQLMYSRKPGMELSRHPPQINSSYECIAELHICGGRKNEYKGISHQNNGAGDLAWVSSVIYELNDYLFCLKKKIRQTIQLLCHLWFVLHQPDSSRAICRTDYSIGSFLTNFSSLFSLLDLADVLCLDGLGTFDLHSKIIPSSHCRGTEIEEENVTVINEKECLDDSRTHLFRVVQAF